MATFSKAMPCHGTSLRCDIRTDITGTARVDGSGWDIASNLYLYATNALGYPSNYYNNNPGWVDFEGVRKISFLGNYDFPSGPIGRTIVLGSNSYFLAVTLDGTKTLPFTWGFYETDNSAIGQADSASSIVLPTIMKGVNERWNGSSWVRQKAARYSGGWANLKAERWNGSTWKRTK